jgi:hypothetical protein
MQGRSLTIGAIIIGGIAGVLALGWITSWLANGGWPASGPTGDLLPLHIRRVNPMDGAVVTEAHGFCVQFLFQEGNGMGHNPDRTIRFFLDGRNVTKKMNGLFTTDFPPSLGTLCYKSDVPLNSGWHTIKVTYADSTKQKFKYAWRFEVKSGK